MALTPFLGLDTGSLIDDPFLSPFSGSMSLFNPLRGASNMALQTRPLYVDVQERNDKFVMSCDVPDVRQEDVNLEVEGNVLRLSVNEGGETQKDETDASGVVWHRVERTNRFASRSLRFPDTADTQKVNARMDHGVLRIEIAKKESAEGMRKSKVPIRGGA